MIPHIWTSIYVSTYIKDTYCYKYCICYSVLDMKIWSQCSINRKSSQIQYDTHWAAEVIHASYPMHIQGSGYVGNNFDSWKMIYSSTKLSLKVKLKSYTNRRKMMKHLFKEWILNQTNEIWIKEVIICCYSSHFSHMQFFNTLGWYLIPPKGNMFSSWDSRARKIQGEDCNVRRKQNNSSFTSICSAPTENINV